MSEAEKSAEVEDVLSSIRRLVADGPRVDEQKAQPLNLASSRIEPPLTAHSDIDEAMEELPVEEDIVLETPSFIPEEDVLKPSEDTISQIPEIGIPEADGPITFVQAINASIAEMAKGQDTTITQDASVEKPDTEETVELSEDTTTDEREAHVNAFLANEASMPSEIDEPASMKSEPFVLRADMAAISDDVEETTNVDAEVSTKVDMESDFEDDAFEYSSEEAELPNDTEDDTLETSADYDDGEPTGDAFIDEETLREIVGELVRAELQGDLGDRITRNVRKLVRREIHHALASREIP